LFIEKGYTLPQVILFYALMSFGFVISCFLALKTVSKWGVKWSIVISYVILVVSFVMIFFMDYMRSYYWFIGLFQGLSYGLFWIAFHVDAALHVPKKTAGKSSGLISFASVAGSVTGPILGALLIKFFSFNVLFFIALSLFIVSFIPLLFSRDVFIKTDFHFKRLFLKDHVKYALGYFAQGIRYTAAGVFWPMFAFLILGSYLTLGWFSTLATLLVGVFGYFVGKYSDKFGKGRIIRLFAPVNAIAGSVRVFAWNVLSVFGFGFFESISSAGIDVPLLAKTYNKAKREEIAGFVFFREFVLRIGEIFGLIIGFLFGLKLALVISSAGSLLFLLF
jgi:MFS family permease